MNLLEEARKLSEEAQAKNNVLLMSKVPELITLITHNIKQEASKGYKSFTFRFDDAGYLARKYAEDFEEKGVGMEESELNKYNSEIDEDNIRRAVSKALIAHYKGLGFMVSSDCEAKAKFVQIRW